MERPEEVRTSQKSPMETTGPREAISSPTISVTSPIHGSTSIRETCWIEDPIGELEALPYYCSNLSIRPRSISRNWVSTDASSRPCEVSKNNFAGIQSWIGGQHQVLGRTALLQALSNQRFQARMHAHAVDLAGLKLRECRFHQTGQRVRIDDYLAVNHARRDQRGQPHQVLQRFFAKRFAQAREFGQVAGHFFEGWKDLLLGILAAGGYAFLEGFPARLFQGLRGLAGGIRAGIVQSVGSRRCHGAPECRRGGPFITK